MIQKHHAPHGSKDSLSGPLQKKFRFNPGLRDFSCSGLSVHGSLYCELIFEHAGETLSGAAETPWFLACTLKTTEMLLTQRGTGGTNSPGERTLERGPTGRRVKLQECWAQAGLGHQTPAFRILQKRSLCPRHNEIGCVMEKLPVSSVDGMRMDRLGGRGAFLSRRHRCV